MGRKCCVPDCNSNYDAIRRKGQSAISTFKFPVDQELRERWIRAVNREERWQPGSTASICINHFQPEDIVRYDKPAKLKQDAVPTIFGTVLRKEGEPVIKRGRPKKKNVAEREPGVEEETLESEHECVEYLEDEYLKPVELLEELILDFEAFQRTIEAKGAYENWHHHRKGDVVHFYSILDEEADQAIAIENSIKIFKDMKINLFLKGVIQAEESLKWILGQEFKLCLEPKNDSIDGEISSNVRRNPLKTKNERMFTREDRVERRNVREMVRALKKARHRCFICEKEHESLAAFEQHLPDHMDMLPYSCDRCVSQDVTVRTLAALNKHFFMHLKPLKCRVCDVRFSNYGTRLLHEQNSHEDSGPIPCEVCGKVLRSRRGYQHHYKMHSDPDSMKCKLCEKLLSSSYELKLHMRVHTKEKPNKCYFCPASFNRVSNLIEHKRRFHCKERPFVCGVCQLGFRSNAELKRHEPTHDADKTTIKTQRKSVTTVPASDGRKDYHCKVCDTTLPSATSYHSHMRKHRKRFQCSYCGLQVGQLRDFIDHENTHTGNRPYECKICSKKFKTSSTYYGHLAVHSSQKRFACEVCNRRFTRLRHMVLHAKTHSAATSEKPYSCTTCDKTYSDRNSFKRHVDLHLEEDAASKQEEQKRIKTATVQVPQEVRLVPEGATFTLAGAITEQVHQLPQIIQTADGREAILLSAEMLNPQNIIILQQPSSS
ncbi:hypothetical protein pipiens_015570 [Culex pipiens pipiens]|uniref:Uncharacterized protein n=1 Tax=Culex pipiens pipiens TaxID=38569 RepID=A0ABD1CQY2_CULPP